MIEKAENLHFGSCFESWLDEEGIRDEVTAAAANSVIAEQIAAQTRRQTSSRVRVAELMPTSRPRVDRLLDPTSGAATADTLPRAARAVGRELRPELV